MFSNYIRTYDRLAKHTGVLDLCIIEHIPNISLPHDIYGYGVVQVYIDKRPFPNRTFDHTETSDILVHSCPGDKFIITKNGYIFGTPTSRLYIKYENLIARSLSELREKIIIFDELVLIHKLKKKIKLPRIIWNLILLEICKLYLEDPVDYNCKICNRDKDYYSNCPRCDYCQLCSNLSHGEPFCRTCVETRLCKACDCIIDKNGKCPSCDYCSICRKDTFYKKSCGGCLRYQICDSCKNKKHTLCKFCLNNPKRKLAN